jgi:hypothetical protein
MNKILTALITLTYPLLGAATLYFSISLMLDKQFLKSISILFLFGLFAVCSIRLKKNIDVKFKKKTTEE